MNQGIALLNTQQLPQASAVLRKVIAQDPKNTAAWYNLGLVARKNGNTAETIEDFKQAVALDPNNADTHYLLGSGYQQNKDYKNAIVQFQAALQLNPLHASAEFGLARAYQETGAVDNAKQAFQRFQHITGEKLGSPMTISYGEMGSYSMAQSIHVAEPEVGPMIPVRFRARGDRQRCEDDAGSERGGGSRWWRLHAGSVRRWKNRSDLAGRGRARDSCVSQPWRSI